MLDKLIIFLTMIKFSHTLFALPFALSGALLAAGGLPAGRTILWIVVAMAGARTGAMAFNRFADADIDASNPRTRDRAIPRGLMTSGQVAAAAAISFGVMIFAAGMLNRLCFILSFPALFFLVGYSYMKRVTSLSHVILGLCLGAAPVGAWIAVTGFVSLAPLILGLAVLFWVAGFDILYALQDVEFDKTRGLFSIPVKLGVKTSILLARAFHAVMVALLLLLSALLSLGTFYLAGVAVISVLLVYEHSLVSHRDLGKLNVAFFNMNGYISVVFMVAVAVDIYWRTVS